MAVDLIQDPIVKLYSSSSFSHKLTILLKSKSKQTIQINAHKIKSKYDQN